METQVLYEIIGYVASVLVAVSLMMRSIVRLRVINLAGSLTFTAYGLLIAAYPVAAVNGFIVLINLYYLFGMRRTQEYFRLLEVPPESVYLEYFLRFHEDDLRRFRPDFRMRPQEGLLTLFVLRDLVPAGVFIARPGAPGTLEVLLDYVIPQYRDFKLGRFLFTEQAAFFRERGIGEIVSEPGNEMNRAYLLRMGFRPSPDGRFRLTPGDASAV